MKAKELIKIGYPSGPWISLLLDIFEKGAMKRCLEEDKQSTAEDLLANPENYRNNPVFCKVVEKLYPPKQDTDMRTSPVDVKIYGADIIEEGALHQIYQAAKLPIAYKAALMPDAHAGYGLPIGGVLACENAIVPYGVGVDIGCRMALSIFPLRDFEDRKTHDSLVRAISQNTFFGAGVENSKKPEHVVMDDLRFTTLSVLRNLKEKAARQLGTSGSGNHFVEFGELEMLEDGLLERGKYLALLTHSGSRGLGANVAKHYTNLAKRLRKLDSNVSHLAWLRMDEQEGMEYWEAMNLAGEYAKANHDVIHHYIAKQLKEKPLFKVENHHNFAWKELVDGRECIVHRKGATPAQNATLGIIPGSMSTPGYLVAGRGIPESLNSASHGAGRTMSRSKAKESFIWHDIRKELEEKKVHLIGGGVDESSGSYKDVNAVMSRQQDLVDILAKFTPRIVKMAGDDEEPED